VPEPTVGAAGLSTARAVIAAGATGFGVMSAELTAVRLLAPHFGDSAYVWTNVIGVILAAMALGASVGGRLAASETARRWPSRLLLIGGLLLALAPSLCGWLGRAVLPADLPLDAAMPVLIRGSLLTASVVFAPPLLLLAAVSPLLVVLLTKRGLPVGRAAGDVAAAGTVGSLLGTFIATHTLVPFLGCRLAMLVSAGVLLVAAAILVPAKGRAGVAAGMLLALLSSLLHQGPLRAAPSSVELLAERETAYQLLQVQRRTSPAGAETRLVINEGLDSFHSLARQDSAFTGAYYDWHALAPAFLAQEAAAPDLRVLSIGDAAGSLRSVYGALYPTATIDAVDIDGETMLLGDEFFDAPVGTGARYELDGRQFLANAKAQWQVIHIDAYAHQVYIPAHLASREFFEAAFARLTQGGVLACNVGGLRARDPVLTAIASTVASVFGDVKFLLLPRSRNALLVAQRGGDIDPTRLASVSSLGALSQADRAYWKGLTATAADASRWHEASAEGPVLCDDQPLLDELLLDSYVDNRDQGVTVLCGGPRAVMDAEQAAYEAVSRSDWDQCLSVVSHSIKPSAFLCLQAGDARWSLRQLRSAALEYDAGLSLAPSDDLRRILEARVSALDSDLRPVLAAEAAAGQLWWFNAIVLCAAGALTVLARRL